MINLNTFNFKRITIFTGENGSGLSTLMAEYRISFGNTDESSYYSFLPDFFGMYEKYESNLYKLTHHGENAINILFNMLNNGTTGRNIKKDMMRFMDIDLSWTNDESIELSNRFTFKLVKQNRSVEIFDLSEGIKMILCYCILAEQVKINPPKILFINCPERYISSKLIKYVAELIIRMSEHTQVIVKTYNPDLLNEFPAYFLDSGIMEVIIPTRNGQNVEPKYHISQLRKTSPSVSGWIDDFGIGSAIYDSGLILK
jgi:hypothetical protein